MLRKIKRFILDNKKISIELINQTNIPKQIVLKENFLEQYIKKELICPGIEILFMKDWNHFCNKFARSWVFWKGFYFNEKDYPEKYSERLREMLNEEIKRAIFLPDKKIEYWTLIHELLHDYFSFLPEEKKEKMINTMRESYNTKETFNLIFRIIPEWTRFSLKQNENKKRIIFDDFTKSGQEKIVDEFIAHFFTREGIKDRQKNISSSFKKILEDYGYNIQNPPQVKR